MIKVENKIITRLKQGQNIKTLLKIVLQFYNLKFMERKVLQLMIE